ncbi:DUF3618 domain-containing protein [Sphaerisporangium krabiense]|uniref:Acyl-coenzyme A synthetase/AMP-(Fatty) acid ligase n=1 Tax=Sphaerisporangium krabiense TaxID=763782 RepID=A0A7W8YYV0_9ACTN|nr:DUF3618 domain-containing protein [Sphaerisporangium krabiense]MBB5624363.1 acyl-coenzyme A synthetase/AMP-(fatty) acid ligase [Sphaerisporangium krabiense]
MADTDPEALERRIERSRAELAVTVDAIVDRISPKRVAERGVAKVKANAEQVIASAREAVGLGPAHEPYSGDEAWRDERPAANLAPILIGVGAIVVVGAAIAMLRRRRRG